MPWWHILWTDRALRKIDEHGITPQEVEYVLFHPDEETVSRSSGLPAARGRTAAGREIFVVYRDHDDGVTVEPITAYEV